MSLGGRKGIKLTERQRLSWLQLIRSENVGTQTFRKLIEHFGSAENALAALPDLAAHGGKKNIRIAKREDAEKELEFAKRHGVQFIGIGEPDYPDSLRQIDGSPPLIAVKGDLETLNRKAIGIVGSRNASAAGMRITASFAKTLGENGFSIISGFARGIDTVAHKSSLKSGTIAAVAGGIDQIYPLENSALYDEIIANNGTIISEMPMGWEPRAKDFPRRNRIIAAIGTGLLVVEAAKQSGSLITARLAADFGRLVFAIPGSPLDPRAMGTNTLIKEGANLVDCAEDIIELIKPLVPEMSMNLLDMMDSRFQEDTISFPEENSSDSNSDDINDDDISDNEREHVLSCLSVTPIDIETISVATRISIPKLYLILMELDLAGRILRHSGGFISLNCIE